MGEAVPQVQFPGEESADAEETPNFGKMKKSELLAFVEEHEVPLEGASGMKVGELKNALGGLFGQFVPSTPTGLEDGNTLHEVVQQIQGIEDEASAIAEVLSIQDQSNFSMFRIGGVLARMLAKGWMGESEDGDFYDFVENTFAMKKRKAQYAVGVFNKLVELDIPWSDASKLGWTKLRLLHTVLDEENVNEILASVASLTTREVEQFAKDFKTNDGGGAGGSSDSNAVTRLSFPVHEDQKENIQLAISKAKEEGSTDFDGMALEYICLDYLNSGAKPVAKTMTVPEAIKYAKKHTSAEDQEALVAQIIESFTKEFPDAVEAE